jgi:hypothetical protein
MFLLVFLASRANNEVVAKMHLALLVSSAALLKTIRYFRQNAAS